MALPDSRDVTFVDASVDSAGSIIPAAVLNNIQDQIIRLHGLRLSNWSEQAAAGAYSDDFNAVCFEQSISFGTGIFVAVGDSGEIQTSPNGAVWTQQVTLFSGDFLDVAFGSGVFVMVGDSNIIRTSPDAETWTGRTSAFGAGAINGIAFGASLFVAVGVSGRIQTSPDGTTWTARTPAAAYAGEFLDVAFCDGLFVAIGATGEIQTSPNGTTWTSLGAGFGAITAADIAFGSGLYLLATNTGNVYESDDLLAWTFRASGRAVAYGDTGFVAVGSGGSVSSSSALGTDWRPRPPIGSETLLGTCYGNGRWVAVGANAQIVASFAI